MIISEGGSVLNLNSHNVTSVFLLPCFLVISLFISTQCNLHGTVLSEVLSKSEEPHRDVHTLISKRENIHPC